MRQSIVVSVLVQLVYLQDVCAVAGFSRPIHTPAGQSQTGTVRVLVRAEDKPVEKAEVLAAGVTQQTDASGTLQIQVPAGEAELIVVKSGYVTTTLKVTVQA